MANFAERDKPKLSQNPWRDERPPSPHVLKLALIAAAIILLIGILVYLKARHAPPALHDELQLQNAPNAPLLQASTSGICARQVFLA
ncbi:MAG TPA: hypothetical protein VGR93_08145 [Candidatus Acidoferrales bacterium]|nr:hypothetical protein [Candidatus Acidoferrales bacterium]